MHIVTLVSIALVALAIGLFVSAFLPPRLSRKLGFRIGAFSIIALLVIGNVACTAAWLAAVSAMLPSIEALATAVLAFVAGLQGKSISEATAAAIARIGADIKGEIVNGQVLIADFQTSQDTALLGKISAVFQGILASFQSILANASITDAATVSKLTQLVGFAIAAVTAVLGLIPLVSAEYSRTHVDLAEAQHADKQAASLIAHHHKALQEGYAVWHSEKTGIEAVDEAVAACPATV